MADSFQITCEDWKVNGVLKRTGCGRSIIMKKVGTKDDGKPAYKPFNADGSEHRHLKEDAKPFTAEVADVIKKNEGYIRQIAREEVGKALSERGLGVDG